MATSSEVFHFDEFTLDVRERRLLRGAEVVRVSPKAYDVLVALVQQRGRLVTKDELLSAVWPESFVEEGGLTVHMSALRKALGEDAHRPIYIETVAGSGYRFIAAVRFDSGNETPFASSAVARPVELYELVGRGRSHLLSDSFSNCRPPWTPFVPRSRSIRPMHRRTPDWRAHGACSQRLTRCRTRKRLQRRRHLPYARWRWTARVKQGGCPRLCKRFLVRHRVRH